MDKRDITPTLAARLVAAQFPQWADLPVVPVANDGWDNTTFRLGEELSIRLPSADDYVAQIDKEHRWLPILASQVPVQIPEPVARGRPDERFPRPWSIYRWIEGQTATRDRIGDLTALAADLAGFLTVLEAIDASDGPPPGTHSFFRGGSLAVYDAECRKSIEDAADVIDVAAARDAWQAALASTWERRPVWVHGDVAPTNLLVNDGVLEAVIDFGCMASGDPACDLVMAWTFFDDQSRSVFRDTIDLDEATWSRARGWALWKALITHVRASETGTDPDATVRRFGWRGSALDVVECVLADRA
ncbi:MAG TPA: aminoglycoside phosphotransferase family protein [Ilumatobacteraceae bacterium]|nr:aminoglycoside phosphotransferase family protein [Ilumatobacteraceae bacterium]